MTDWDSTEPLVVAPTLRAAYEAADYEVVGPAASAVLRIGARTPHPAFDGTEAWNRVAVITAWNPFSAPRSGVDNAARQTRLVRDIERMARAHLPALGSDPAGEWTPEPSLAVLDASDDELDEWMLAFGQNAVVVAEAGGVCALRFHPHEETRLGAEGPTAERAAARLWARAWNVHELDLLEGALHDDVVCTHLADGAPLRGRDAVNGYIRGDLLKLCRAELRGEWRPAIRLEHPCAQLHCGDAPTATLVVHFTLHRGSIVRVALDSGAVPRRT